MQNLVTYAHVSLYWADSYVCMWPVYWDYHIINPVMTEHIVDVREGQSSDGFDHYPYDEMKNQSLSVLVEGEKQSR